MAKAWAYVAEADGKFLGACVVDDKYGGMAAVGEWMAGYSTETIIKPVYSREEYDTWLNDLKPEAAPPSPDRQGE